MTSLPDTVVLHLGAHKTATTHLQQSLAVADLPGVSLIGPPQLRGAGQTIPERFGFPLDAARAGGAGVDVPRVLADLAQGAARMVLSDENFAGKLQTGWGRVPMPVYKTAPKRLARLADTIAAAGGPGIDLYLAIRDPAHYLASVYSQVLYGRRLVRPEAFAAKNDPAGIDWADYVVRLMAVPGLRTITVWRFEDYPRLFPDITERMTGIAGIDPVAAKSQQRLSQAALDALMQARAMGLTARAADAAREHPVGPDRPPLSLFDAASRAASQASYAAQWARIAAMPGVTSLQPTDA